MTGGVAAVEARKTGIADVEVAVVQITIRHAGFCGDYK